MNDTGDLLSQNRYLPFGEVRDNIAFSPITQTDFGYTGQGILEDIGLMDYDARFYSPTLMRFTQPDRVMPNPVSPQNFNRYSYVLNNPLIFIDPTGYKTMCLDGEQCFNTDPGSYVYMADPTKDYTYKPKPGKIEEDLGVDKNPEYQEEGDRFLDPTQYENRSDEGGWDLLHYIEGIEQLFIGVAIIGMGAVFFAGGFFTMGSVSAGTLGIGTAAAIAGGGVLLVAGALTIWVGKNIVEAWWKELTEH